MATLKQKTLLDLWVENVKAGNPKTMGELMRDAGYGKISYYPKRVYDSKGFQELLAKIDDNIILTRVAEIMLDTDKRSALTASDMLLKLKDKYPDKKIKLTAIADRDSLFNDNE